MPIPHHFFNLESFFHSDLFLKDQPVWETLKNLKAFLNSLELGKINCDIPLSATLVNSHKISIGENTVVEPGAYIEGPCVIGKGCQVRHGAYVRPFVLTGDECVIGHATEVKHSIFLNQTHAAHFNYVGDSILGNSVNMGAGVVCANFRLDHKEINVDFEGKRFKTDLKKLGAIIGDGSQLGCHSVINPGLLLPKKTFSLPCSSIQYSNLRKRKIDDNKNTQSTRYFSS